MRQGSTIAYLHIYHPSAWLRAGLGSTSLTLNSSGEVPNSRVSCYPYGQTRTGNLAARPNCDLIYLDGMAHSRYTFSG